MFSMIITLTALIASLGLEQPTFPEYEVRSIGYYQTIPVKTTPEGVYFEGESFGEAGWIPLAYFEEITGFRYIRRIDHLFIQDPETGEVLTSDTFLEKTTYFSEMDLREGYTLHPLEAEAMIMKAINYHRFNLQIHSYTRLPSLSLSAVFHSGENRDLDRPGQRSVRDETHQERMELWTLTPNERDYVRSSHTSSHWIEGVFDQEAANQLVDRLMTRETTASFLLNAYYHYLGVGVGIQGNGRLRLTIHMGTARSDDALAYHRTHVRGNREEAYGRHLAQAQAWFEQYHGDKVNPYR